MSAKRWVVIEPPSDHGESTSANAKFVKDSFAPLAFFFLFFWLFYHRLWLAGLAVLALYIVSAAIGLWDGFSLLATVAQFALSLLVGLEARQILISNRLAKGWRMAAIYQAENRAEAELRYFERDDLRAEDGSVTDHAGTRPDPAPRLPWTPRTA